MSKNVPAALMGAGALARFADLSPTTYDAKTRSVEAVLTAGSRVVRWGIGEELAVSPEAVDISRVAAGQCKVLDSHDQDDIDCILGTVSSVRFENGQMIGVLRFGETPRALQAEGMVARGELTGVSIGYRVQVWTHSSIENDIEIWRADKWTLMEASFVSVPADPVAAVRSDPAIQGRFAPIEEPSMKTINGIPAGDPPAVSAETRAAPAAPVAPAPVAPAAPQVEARSAITAEQILDIQADADRLGLRVEADALIRAGGQGDLEIRSALMRKAAEKQHENHAIGGPGRVQITRDAGDTLRRSVESAILLRAAPSALDPVKDRDAIDQARNYRGMSLLETFRDFVRETQGVNLRGLSKMELATLALGMRDQGIETRAGMMSTSDFANVLLAVPTKRLRDAYSAVQQNWRAFCRQSNAPDFKTKYVVSLSGTPTFLPVAEGDEFKYGSMSDGKESYALLTYGRVIPISRQALINDDLSAFDRLPSMLGRAAAEKQNALVWSILTANPNMSDGVALFHSSHGNLAGTAAVVSATSMALAEQAMLEQKDAGGINPGNYQPKYLVVSPKNKVAAQQLLGVIAPNAASSFNPYVNAMQLIVDAYIKPASGAEPWFLIGDPNALDTIEYAFLEGQEGVYTESRVGFEIDGIELKGRTDFAAKAIDWRNMYKNAGT